jgi:hypothetical protein
MGKRLGLRTALWSLIRTPVLLFEAVRAGLAMRGRNRLTPSPHYLAWRMHTAYGDDATTATPDDLAAYLRWRRLMRGLT